MSATNPPFALATTPFRFSALAALAGRAPLGGPREVVLATYLAARLAQDALPDHGLAQASRLERASGARAWLSAMTLPAAVRPSLTRLVEASASEPHRVAEALKAVVAATTSFLDSRARVELERLAAALAAA